MKTNLLRIFLLALFIITATGINAHDFEVDGIYYNITDETNRTVEVTFKGTNSMEYSNEYTGSVVIPSSVTYNGTTYSVTSIRSYAFNESFDLTSVTIPNSVTSIEGYAFSDCSRLTSVTIPNSVTSIGSEAFCSCYDLTSIIVENGNSVYDSRENCNAIIETKTNTLVAGCKKTIIPNNITSIGENAFYYCDGLTSVTIPNSVTSIGENAFYNCYRLTSVTIGNGVTSIGEYAFDGCYGLTSVTIPNSVTSIGSNAFFNCDGLTSVTIGNSVTSIGSNAFCNCSGLTSVTIPNSVTSIGWGAFSNCSGLTSVTIPNSVTSIGNGAFSGCSRLTSVIVENGNSVYDSRNGCNAIIETKTNTLLAGCKNTIIPNSVTSIGNEAFYGCSGLTNITIPNSVTSIGWGAFRYCHGLTSVHISDLSAWCNIEFGDNDANPLYYAKKLYLNGELLTNLIIPDGVTKIKSYVFRNCTGLTSVTIPNSVTSIGEAAFYNCSVLTSVAIGNSVTNIGESAFSNCSGLTSITIPNSVTSIGNNAFSGCSGLKEIYVKADTPPSAYSYTFSGVTTNSATLYVPVGSKDAYAAANGWKKFTNIVEMEFTGIDEVVDEVKGENSKVKDVYDLSGRKVTNPTKGIYIVNGKKVLLK